MRDVIAALSAIERESAKMKLAVNEGKAKYMLTTSGIVPRMRSKITANSYNFDVVKEFIYLGTATQRRQHGNQAQSNYCQQVLFWSQ